VTGAQGEGVVQTTYMTIQALRFALSRTASLIRSTSLLRIAAYAQPVPGAGSWGAVRFEWRNEPERLNELVDRGLSLHHRSLPS
jgi:hypothetical protein